MHPSMYLCFNLPSDEFFHDLVGAGVDTGHADVSVGPTDGVLPHVPSTSVQLKTLVSHLVS